jgi:hypothetical protein
MRLSYKDRVDARDAGVNEFANEDERGDENEGGN